MSPPLFENFSMTLEPGKSVAFIGFSGCGKSTLAKLITGLYTPWSGEVLFDGINIADIDRNEFTASVAMVDQDIVLFEGTIADNIRLWDETIEDYDIVLAARDAQIHSDIIARENGYQGMLTEGGKEPLRRPAAADRNRPGAGPESDPDRYGRSHQRLDNITQKHVSDSLEKMGCTRIVIAHRLSTIQNCDRILVMDRGQIVGD